MIDDKIESRSEAEMFFDYCKTFFYYVLLSGSSKVVVLKYVTFVDCIEQDSVGTKECYVFDLQENINVLLESLTPFTSQISTATCTQGESLEFADKDVNQKILDGKDPIADKPTTPRKNSSQIDEIDLEALTYNPDFCNSDRLTDGQKSVP